MIVVAWRVLAVVSVLVLWWDGRLLAMWVTGLTLAVGGRRE